MKAARAAARTAAINALAWILLFSLWAVPALVLLGILVEQ